MDPLLQETATLAEHNDFLDYGLTHQFGELHMIMDPKSGMKSIIALHSTKLGPALGGCRFIPYPNNAAAIMDAMRLARGMSYKSALANLPLGGGKAVIIQPPHPYNRIDYLTAFGKFVQSLNGRYITAIDSGTNLKDMDRVAAETPYISSHSDFKGDPSTYTADGVFCGIQALVRKVLGHTSLKNTHIAIQGLGHVGWRLAQLLHTAGARLTVADLDATKAEQARLAFNAEITTIESIHTIACDVFSPCALGGIINDETINTFQAPIIAGSANNQLAHTYHGQLLMEKGIVYAVDYAINVGGLLFAANCYLKNKVPVKKHIDNIGKTLLHIVEVSQKTKTAPNVVADHIAEARLA